MSTGGVPARRRGAGSAYEDQVGALGGGADPHVRGFDGEVGELGAGADPHALTRLDQVDEAAVARVVDPPRSVDDALAAPGQERLVRPLDPGAAIEALAGLVARGARPGESAQEQRMRELVARVLELRFQLAAGLGQGLAR